MHYKKRWQGMLTICRKAGKLTMGLEPTKDAMYQGTAAGVLAASDVSEKTYKEAAYFCRQAKIPLITLPFTKTELGQMIGRASGVLGICDDGFFQKMQMLAKEQE